MIDTRLSKNRGSPPSYYDIIPEPHDQRAETMRITYLSLHLALPFATATFGAGYCWCNYAFYYAPNGCRSTPR